MKVITEAEKYYDEIREVIITAFKNVGEADLVETIRETPNYIKDLSLIAVDNDEVVAHIMFSTVTIGTHEALALAPLAVTPKRQKEGIGSLLVKCGIQKCRELDYSHIIVLGHPSYYAKFGFIKASEKGIICPFNAPDEAFMLMVLDEQYADIKGRVIYPEYFYNI